MTPIPFDFDIAAVDPSTAPGLEPGATLGAIGAEPTPAPTPAGIMQKAICLSLELRRLGNTRRVASGAIQTDADRDMVRVNKSLLDSKELAAIAQADGELRRYIAARCLPSMFKAGIYLLPNALIEEVDAHLERFQAERRDLVLKFVASYSQAREAARQKLGSLYDPRDYMADDSDVLAAFSVRTQYVAFDTPGTLRDIKRSIFERERDKAAAQWTEAIEECRQVLRVELLSLVEHATERLAPGTDGKPKIFRDSMLKNLDEFFSTFNARNSIGEDRELSAIVNQARQILAGVDAGALRRRDNFRADVAARLGNVKAQLDTLIRPVARGFAAEAEE